MQRRHFMTLCGAAGLGFAAPAGRTSTARSEGDGAEPVPYEGPYFVVFLQDLSSPSLAGSFYLKDQKDLEKFTKSLAKA